MNLHLLQGDLDFHWLRPAGGGLWPWRGGVPATLPWKEPRLTVSDDDCATSFLPVDCLAMNTGSDGPVLSSYARDVLEEALISAGEVWPVRVLKHRYWWFNCLACVDALDAERTDADWDEVEGEQGPFRWISAPRRLEFRTDAVASAPAVFRVPEFPHGVLFAGDKLSGTICKYNLIGFRMDPVWSESGGGVMNPPAFGVGENFSTAALHGIAQKHALARAILEQRNATTKVGVPPSFRTES